MKSKLIILVLCLGIFSCKNSNPTSNTSTTDSSTTIEDSTSQSRTPQIAQQIADANGIQNWKHVSEISFTFNVDRDGNHFERSWIWKPKTQDITLISLNDTINYNRSKMDSIALKTDSAFINDKYWMLAPFQLVWDTGMEFSQINDVIAPISKDTLQQLTIVYPNQGGYTPGDAYDFYYDKNFIVKEWNYRKGNTVAPSTTTSWEDYKDYSGINIATMHKGKVGDFKLYFTNISITK